jgi:hypothetical protein
MALSQRWRQSSRRAKSPEVIEGGGARRGSESAAQGSGRPSRPHPAERSAGAPKAQIPSKLARRSLTLHPIERLPDIEERSDVFQIEYEP